jgi:hypothetical protein
MKKEFIPYELALELKQLGFDEPCFGYWYTIQEDLKKIDIQLSSIDFLEGEPDYILAPTYARAFRWFREKYDLYTNITKYNDENDTQDKFYYYVSDGYMREEFNTYEEAELACLRKLIEIVKNNHGSTII